MNPSEVAQKLGRREGYKLVSFGYVGLPVFRINAECLVLEATQFGAIEEFLLHAIKQGLDTAEIIAEFLGLPEKIVEIQVADGIRLDRISTLSDGKLSLSPIGKQALEEFKLVKPREIMCNFTYDGLLRQPLHYPQGALLTPAQLRSLSIPEIRAIPGRGPELQELDIERVDAAVKASVSASRQQASRVLQIQRIQRTQRLFLQATALLFKSNVAGDFHVLFAIDGRASLEHEQMFLRSGGIEKSRLFSDLVPVSPAHDLDKDIDPALAEEIKKLTASDAQRPKRSILRLNKHDREQEEKGRIAAAAVRILTVSEHHPLLIDSVDTAKSRLLIISPWIRRDVVNQDFIEKLAACLDRGVTVYIGFGIGHRDKEKEIDHDCDRDLERLASAFSNFQFRWLGDTHAKILLKDDDFFVISSFNWLSFRGDPRRPFREELGNMVTIPNLIDKFFDDLRPRFEEPR